MLTSSEYLDRKVGLSLEEMISTAKKTILFNFKRIKTIIITIEGQVPGAREETAVSAGT